MNPFLHPCPNCSRHVRTDETTCPFCSAQLEQAFEQLAPPRVPKRRMSRAALLALGTMASSAPLVACGGDTEDGEMASGGSDSGGSESGGSDGGGGEQMGGPVYGLAPSGGASSSGGEAGSGGSDGVGGDSMGAGGDDGTGGDVMGAGGDQVSPVYGAPEYGAPVYGAAPVAPPEDE